MAAVLPQEVADERLPAPPVAPGGQEGMVQLARDPPDVEHPVAALAPLQVDRRDVQAVPEQEVRRRGVPVQPHLPVLPHPWALPPHSAQPGELVDVPHPDAPALPQHPQQVMEVRAVGGEVDGCSVRRPVVLGGEVVGQCPQAPVEVPVVTGQGPVDRLAELLNCSPS
jgi:hypothetical protein